MSRLKNRRGQGLVEYILIVAVIGIAAITMVQRLGTTVDTGFTNSSTKLQQALNH